MLMRRFAAVAAAAAVMATLAGCGSGDQASSEAGSSSPSSPSSLGKRTLASFSGDVLAAQRQVGSAHVEARLDFSGQQGTISGDFAGLDRPSALKMDLSADIAGQQVDIVFVDGSIYLRGAGLSGDPARPWVTTDLDDPGNPLSSILDSVRPASFTAYLKAVTKLEDRGEETVDGVRADHYTATIDTAEMLRANAMFRGQDASALGLPRHLSSDVWIDGASLPVEMSVSLGDVGSIDVHFSEYGRPVVVRAPPAARVSRLTF